MTKWFYDTEFLEDGKTIDPISIGMVSDDGREYYAVFKDMDTRRIAKNDWLMKNVMNTIDHEAWIVHDFEGKPAVRDIHITDKAAKSRQEIADDIYDLTVRHEPVAPQFWAWYSAYDHVVLAQVWGKMIDLPQGMPMYTNDIRTLVDLAGGIRIPAQTKGNHNALDDARFNVVRYEYLMDVLQGA